MQLQLRAYADRVEARLIDQGAAFVPPEEHQAEEYQAEEQEAAMPDPLELAESGYGLALVRLAVDALDYSRTGDGRNCWLLVKRV